MMQYSLDGIYPDGSGQVLWEDGERVFCRGWRLGDDSKRSAVLVVSPAAEHPSPSSLDHLTHEYSLKDELDGTWAVRPLDLVRQGGRTTLVLEDAGGEPLDRLLGAPMEVGCFLRLAIRVAKALGKVHQRGLVHKDIKPTNVLLNDATGEVRLTGFGIASRLSRERQAAKPPEALNGTLAYLAPEQTGRMNRSIDSRSDLYALGVTFYQMLTGALPFTAADPMEWVHCHLAKQPVAPADRVNEIPDTVSAIIMKLLAKTAEDRYQTAAGLESDLGKCLTEWEAQRRIDDFPLGERDTPDRLLIPEKLYGRRPEVETLLASFDRIVNGGAKELVPVSGYSGVGKSSVVNELHKALVPPRGLFASGKFDQYKRDIPYSTLAQAFQSLIRDLLAKSEAELGGLARRPPRGAGPEWTAHDRPCPGAEADHRRTAACGGASATIETRGMKGPRTFDGATGLPLHKDNQTVILERIYLDKADPQVLHNDITTIDHALTRPWTVHKTFRREKRAVLAGGQLLGEQHAENNTHMSIGGQDYVKNGYDGQLMPARKDQPPPDLRYFERTK
jgi:serine/threonine protein kinase